MTMRQAHGPAFRKGVSGFTLIEILIVVAVVGILAAILLPVFARVRDGARTATCASNLRQIGLGIQMYVADNNRRYPPVAQPARCTWADSIYPYVKSTQVFLCPKAPHGEYRPGCGASDYTNDDPPVEIGYNGSYDLVSPLVEVDFAEGENDDGSGFTEMRWIVQPKGLHETRYRFPSSTILALDGGHPDFHFHRYFAALNPGAEPITSVEDLKSRGVIARHDDGNNVLFADGHVKWLSLQALTKRSLWRADGKD